MPITPFWDKVFATASWLVVVALVFGAFSYFFLPPHPIGPVAKTVGVVGAAIFYASLYIIEATLLAYSKFFKKKKMRKGVLLSIYLTGFFTSILSFLLLGIINIRVWDNIVISSVSAACWLYWTFKTEYIDPRHFYDEVYEIRRDNYAKEEE